MNLNPMNRDLAPSTDDSLTSSRPSTEADRAADPLADDQLDTVAGGASCPEDDPFGGFGGGSGGGGGAGGSW